MRHVLVVSVMRVTPATLSTRLPRTPHVMPDRLKDRLDRQVMARITATLRRAIATLLRRPHDPRAAPAIVMSIMSIM